MPWKASDSSRFTKKANSPRRQRMWKAVSNRVLKATGDEGRAVRSANSVVRKDSVRSARRRNSR